MTMVDRADAGGLLEFLGEEGREAQTPLVAALARAGAPLQPGVAVTGEGGRVSWDLERIALFGPRGGLEVALGRGELTSIQLSRSIQLERGRWWQRALGQAPPERFVLNVCLRGRGGRLRLRAPVTVTGWLAGLPLMQQGEGPVVTLVELHAVLRVARALGAQVARWHTPGRDRCAEVSQGLLPEVVVLAGGGGDVLDVHEAALRVAPGGTIRLSQGTHALREPLRLRHAVRLTGEGAGRTRLVSDGLEAVIEVEADARVRLEGMTIEPRGRVMGSGVRVTRGRLVMSACEVRGARRGRDADGGVGVEVAGEASAALVGCHVLRNQRCGVLVRARARLRIEGSCVERNGEDGVRFEDSSEGTARDVALLDNHGAGLAVRGAAAPDVARVLASGNQGHGALIEGTGAPRLSSCRLSDNRGCGLMVREHATPRVTHSALERNAQDGARFDLHAGGALEDCLSANNNHDGVRVGWKAALRLERVACRYNYGDGLSVQDHASVTLVDGELLFNSGVGLRQAPSSRVTQRGCIIKGNNGASSP